MVQVCQQCRRDFIGKRNGKRSADLGPWNTNHLCPPLNVTIVDEHYKRFPKNSIKVVMRRKDLDKEGPEVRVAEGANNLAPGDWEIRVITGDEYYAKDVRVATVRAQKRSHDTAEGWVLGQIPITSLPVGVPMSIALSSRVASLSGRAMDKTNEPAPYAPVLLETLGLDPPDPPIQREVRAGAEAHFNSTVCRREPIASSPRSIWTGRTATP